MPDKLENLLLNRPVKVDGEVQYPVDNTPKGPVERFTRTLLGLDEQAPGDLPSALGAAAGLVPFGAVGRAGRGLVQGVEEGGSLLRAIKGLGKGLEEGESIPRMLFNHTIDNATENSRTRWQRELGNRRVNAAYNNLLTQDAIQAPTPKEVKDLADTVAARKASGITVQPTGMDVAKHQTNIINKLVASGYKPTPEDISNISRYTQEASFRTGDQLAPRGTGDYVRYIKGAVAPGSPLKRALQNIPSWADGQTVSRFSWMKR